MGGRLAPLFQPLTDTSLPGLHTARAFNPSLKGWRFATGGLTSSFAVNFFPARPAPAFGPATIHTGHVQAGQTLTTSVPVGVAWVCELLALAALAAEWWIAFRGMRLR